MGLFFSFFFSVFLRSDFIEVRSQKNDKIEGEKEPHSKMRFIRRLSFAKALTALPTLREPLLVNGLQMLPRPVFFEVNLRLIAMLALLRGGL